MEQIPTEVMEKIRIAVEDFYGSEQSGEYKSTYEKGCECGYRLASPCALCEGKEKEIAELKRQVNDLTMGNMTHEYNQAEAERTWTQFKQRIIDEWKTENNL